MAALAEPRKKRYAPLSDIAELGCLKLDMAYYYMRLPHAPQPAAHVACLPVYDVDLVLGFLRGQFPPDFSNQPIPFPDASSPYNDASEE